MSEVPASGSSAPEVAAAAAPPEVSAGTLLREAREAAGLHVAALAVALKVPPAKLEALEQGRYDELPDAVFVRGLASAICRTLKIDAAPVLQRLPRTSAPRLVHDTDGINTPFRSPRDAVASDWREQATRPVSIVVGVLLLAAVVVMLLPKSRPDDEAMAGAKPGNKAPVAASVTAPSTVATTAQTASAVPAQAPAASELVAAASSLPASSATASSFANPAAASPAHIAAAPAAAASGPVAAAAAAGGGVIVFRATGPSWIEVRDAKGVVAVRKVLGPGEDTAASGAMPLQVIVGRADVTQVQVRGQPFDLRPFARDNVARFEIK